MPFPNRLDRTFYENKFTTHISFFYNFLFLLPPGSSVGIVPYYRLDGPRSNPGGVEIFRPSRPSLRPTQPLVNGYRVFPVDRGGRGVRLTPHSHLECRGPTKSRAIPPLTLRAFVAYEKGETLPISPINLNFASKHKKKAFLSFVTSHFVTVTVYCRSSKLEGNITHRGI